MNKVELFVMIVLLAATGCVGTDVGNPGTGSPDVVMDMGSDTGLEDIIADVSTDVASDMPWPDVMEDMASDGATDADLMEDFVGDVEVDGDGYDGGDLLDADELDGYDDVCDPDLDDSCDEQ